MTEETTDHPAALQAATQQPPRGERRDRVGRLWKRWWGRENRMWVCSLRGDTEGLGRDTVRLVGGWTQHGYWVGHEPEPDPGPPVAVVRCAEKCMRCLHDEDMVRGEVGMPKAAWPLQRRAHDRAVPMAETAAGAIAELAARIGNEYGVAVGATRDPDPLAHDIATRVLLTSTDLQRQERRRLRDELHKAARAASGERQAGLLEAAKLVGAHGVTFYPGIDRDPYE